MKDATRQVVNDLAFAESLQDCIGRGYKLESDVRIDCMVSSANDSEQLLRAAEIIQKESSEWERRLIGHIVPKIIQKAPKLATALGNSTVTAANGASTPEMATPLTVPTPPVIESSFSCRAYKRFALWVHFNCDLTVSGEGFRFTDKNNARYSFDLPFSLLATATLLPQYNTDLIIKLADGTSYEIGLDAGDRQRIIDVIEKLKQG